MTTIGATTPAALPAAADPFAGLKREIRQIVTDSANDVFRQQQPLIRTTISDAISDQMSDIRIAVGGAIEDQLPNIRTQVEVAFESQLPAVRAELDDFIDASQPRLQAMVDDTIERVKAELPGVIDAEVARQRAAIGEEIRPIVQQQTDNMRHVGGSALTGGAIGAGVGALGGFALGFKAWNGASGGLLAAAGLAALGATAGLLAGGWRGVSTLEASNEA